ncbi:MAG TPA: GxxExxY protein [Myxococcota bacterium]|nr:GxxExxY protein [Myxococcota bacterium]
MDGDSALTEVVIGAAIQVHRALGAGLLESAYEACLAHELTKQGVPVQRQVECPVRYDGLLLDAGYRLDLLVADKLVVELKATDKLLPIHLAQVLTYLRLRDAPVGLLLNFNTVRLTDGIRRVINAQAPRPPRPPRFN